MTEPRRPSNQHRPAVDREGPTGLRFGMFATCVVRDGSEDISGKPKELYILLVTFADTEGRDTDKGYPYRTALAKALGCSTKTVDRATCALEGIGLVSVHRRKLPGSTENDANRYELHDGWLIHGVEPSRRVPTQLVERYGCQIRGFDVAAFLGRGGDTDVSTLRDTDVATGRDTGVPQSRAGNPEPSPTDGGAPSARSAGDGRQATSGSRSQWKGGKAASGKNSPFLTPQEGKLVAAVFRALPEDLQALLPDKKPSNLKRAVLEALAVDKPYDRTPEQLAAFRVGPKWWGFYQAQHIAGDLEKPVGALIAMLRRDKECGNDRCDERVDVDSQEPCRFCATAKEDRKAAKHAPAGPAASQPEGASEEKPPHQPTWDSSSEPDYYPDDVRGDGEGEPPAWAVSAEDAEPVVPAQGGGLDDFAAARAQMRDSKSDRIRRTNQYAR